MPTVLATNQILQFRIFCRNADRNQISVNVINYNVQNVVGANVTDQDAVTFLDTLYHTPMKQMMPVTCQYYGTSAQVVFPRPPGVPVTSIARQGPGTVLGEQLPSQTAGLIALTTAIAGPKYRGRMYVPFPGEDDNTVNGLPSALYIAKLSTLGVLRTTVETVPNGAASGTVELHPIIWHREDDTRDLIIGHRERPAFATIRRRGELRRGDVPPF